jgi:glycosyltransferase involved in cell wall biosynthesis
MKIAHIISTFPPYQGGMGNSVACFAKELLPFGHEVTVLTPNFKRAQDETDDWQGIKVVRLKPLLALGNAAILPGILLCLKEFDVVHLHYPFYGTAELVILAKLFNPLRLKLAVHYHMDTKARGGKGLIFSLYNAFWLPLILRLADAITCASLDYVKHSFIGGYYLKHRDKFTQVSFGVDLEQFQPDHNYNGAAKNILFVGGLDRAHYFKGVDNLIKAFALVAQKLPQARLTILGNGELAQAYQHLARLQQLGNKITFVENVSDEALVSYYQQASLLVLPSINQNEAFGLVLLEAMACGKPVVASNLPGVRSVFKNGKQGLIVKPGDINDVAEKIIRILQDEKTQARMGEAARALVEKKYSWAAAGEKLNEIYYRIRYVPKLKHTLKPTKAL